MRGLRIRSTIVSKVRRGLPRQFCVMWQKRWCPIVFHLVAAGGKWQTRVRRFKSFASACNLTFQTHEAIAVAATSVRGNERLARVRIRGLAHHPPPLPNRGDRRERVVIASNADPRLVARHIRDAIWDGLTDGV